MRIERLALECFGPFDGHAIEFRRHDDGTDLHLVYGANEAGKTSLRTALDYLLHGMPSSTPYAFGRDYKLLQIGATLECDGQRLGVRRLKNALLDEHGERLEESAIDLQGLSREEALVRFSFDERTLREGGEAIIANKGELGAALYSAAAGLADVGTRLDEASGAAGAFYDWSKRQRQPIDLLGTELAELDQRIEAADLKIGRWRELDETRQAREESVDDLKVARREAYAALNRSVAAREARTDARRVVRLREQLDALGPLPDVAPDLLTGFAADRRTLDGEAGRLAQLRRQRTDQQGTLDGLPVDDAVLAHRDSYAHLRGEIDRLGESAALVGAQRERHGILRRHASRLRTDAGWQSASEECSDRPDRALLDAMSDLLAERDALATTARSAADELRRLDSDSTIATTSPVPEHDDKTPDALLVALDRLLLDIEERSPASRRDSARLALDEAIELHRQRRASLAPWRGSSDDLDLLPCPTRATIDALDQRERELLQRQSVLRTRVEEDAPHAIALEAERDALADAGVVERDTVERARTARDAALERLRHLAPADAPSGLGTGLDTLADATHAADALADAWHAAAASGERLSRLTIELATLHARAEQHAADTTGMAKERTALADERAALLQACVLDTLPWPDLPAWLTRREQTLSDWRAELRARAESSRCEQAVVALTDRLLELLRAIDPDGSVGTPDFEECLRAARAIKLDAAERGIETARRRALQDHARQERARREADRDGAQAALVDWQTRWSALAAGTPLADAPLQLVRTRLEALQGWLEALDELDQLDEALHHFSADETRCREAMNALMTALDEPEPASGITGLRTCLDAIGQRLTRASASVARRAELSSDTARLSDEIATGELAMAPASARLDALATRCELGDGQTLESVVDALNEAHRLRTDLGDAERQLRERLGEEVDKSTLQRLLEIDDETLAARTKELAQVHDETDAALQAGQALALDARKALEGLGDDEQMQRLNMQRAALLEEIGTRAEAALRSRLGRLAVDAGIRRFRDTNRSGMLEATRDSFRALTLNRFSDVQTRPNDKGGEFLVAITHDGVALQAEQMSQGTAIQLYLSLRIAAYRSRSAQRTPLPFVADDILQSADDERTAAVFEQFTSMASHGQLIYLTHHEHLIELARRASAGRVQVHRLDPPSRPVAHA